MLAAAGFGRIHSAFFAPVGFDLEVLLVEVVARDDVALAEVGVAGVLDLHAVHQLQVLAAELELVDDRAGQETGVADDSTRTLRSIWAMMISRCLSSISTRWER